MNKVSVIETYTYTLIALSTHLSMYRMVQISFVIILNEWLEENMLSC